jgi:hypothetical protein
MLMLVILGSLCGPAVIRSPVAQAQPEQRRVDLRLLDIGRQVPLDSSLAEASAMLRAGGLSIEQQQDLPPDGLTRLLLAVPNDDDCLPRGTWLVCPSVRVFLLNDPQRGHRVVRVEAYQHLDAAMTVIGMFEQVAAALGPALQTEMAPEAVRGGSVVVWRQRWREDLADSIVTEVMVTQDAPAVPTFGLADPSGHATGIGFVRADVAAEGSIASVRRRLGGSGR